MKAILLRRTGDPSVLEYTDVPTPRPGDGEVLVRADTIGVSMPEVLVRKGAYAWMPPLPAIPGIEMSGTIVECGGGVAGRAVGDKVFVSARDLPVRAGCYAEYIAVPSHAAHAARRGVAAEVLRYRDKRTGPLHAAQCLHRSDHASRCAAAREHRGADPGVPPLGG